MTHRPRARRPRASPERPPPTPHDALFKALFAESGNAAALLRSALPRALVEAADWETLELVRGSVVDARLAQRHTDLLYRVHVAGIETQVPILFEHLAEPLRRTALRMLGYEQRLWEEHDRSRAEERLPPIVAVVVTHGTRAWTESPSFEDLVAVPPELAGVLGPFVPRFRYVLLDVATMSDEELLSAAGSDLARVGLFLFRDARARSVLATLRAHFEILLALERGRRVEAVDMLLRYSVPWVPDEEQDQLIEMIAALGPQAKERTMRSVADRWIDEGKEKGLAEGLAKGRAEGRAEGLRVGLRGLLRLKFGRVNASVETRIASADADTLERWSERVLIASSIEDALADG